MSGDQAPRTRPDWSASYTYQRWQPSFYVAAQDRTSLFQAVTEPGALVPVAQREQTVDVGAWFPVRRIRWVQTMLASYHVERLTTDLPLTSDRPNARRVARRLDLLVGTPLRPFRSARRTA